MDLTNTQKILAGAAVVTVLVVGGFDLEKYIIPEQSVQKDEQLPGDIQQEERAISAAIKKVLRILVVRIQR